MTAEVLALVNRIEETRQRWWLASLLCRLAIAGLVTESAVAVALLIDQFLPYGPASLVGASILVALLGLTAFSVAIAATVRQQRSLEAAARRIEASFPELDGKLVSLIQLARVQDPLAQAAARRLIAEVTGRPIEEANARLPWHERIRFGLATKWDAFGAVGLLVLMTVLLWAIHAIVPGWGSSFGRLLAPWSFTPHRGSVRILDVRPGDTVVLQGKPLQVTVVVELPRREAHLPGGTLFFRTASGRREPVALVPDDAKRAYLGTVPSVVEEGSYYVQVGNTQSRVFQVRVTTPPELTRVRITYEYPPYTRRPPRTAEQPDGNLSGLQFTQALVEYDVSSPISRGYVETSEGTIPGSVVRDGRALRVRFLLLEDMTYTVSVFNELGIQNPSPQPYRITVQPDRPPKIALVAPPDDGTIGSGGTLLISVQASDDYGLRRVWCEARVLKKEGADAGADEARGRTLVLHEWRLSEEPAQFAARHEWTLAAARYPPGTVLYVRAVAEDNRYVSLPGREVKPQRAVTDWVKVTVVSPQKRASELVAALSDLRAQLNKLLQIQLEARLLVARALANAQPNEFGPVAREALGRQRAVREEAGRIIDAHQGAKQSFVQLTVRTLSSLHDREMAEAIRLAERLPHSGELNGRKKAAEELMGVQDEIIAVLSKLLDLARTAETRALAEAERKEGGDLPTEPVLDKLRELKEKLDEFLRQQKRVIEASENLAKKPVEDFTKEDEKLLEELAAVEDDWARFMGEARSDLSKLPEQDFANPSLLEELVEIETELKMAADALTKKTVEIAVPLEQLGAERAEEMTTNIEKWLPDTPDRERWMQEEPLDDMFKSAPMAELPGELEDLVGELMEEEEDLFEEMEDVSSSWADSIDKGAGWDAADGPISNMSARGVTGNRLPNNSEIAGRSGEGRQGKAHGEFVSETAVGKGGRKTPTRLTPDPFVEGQVKDTSKDPVGGATGGGKQSGVGGEGLEGPAPARPDILQRLAQKQAALRNKAEVIDLRFRVSQYHHTDLRALIERMKQVELDLRAGRLHQALRRREEILNSLRELKRYAGGEVRTRSEALAERTRTQEDELLQGGAPEVPPGWEELTRRYFDKLGKQH